jgi:hypothetical protein
MLLIIPVLSGLMLFLDLLAIQKPAEGESVSLRKVFIETLILLGVFVAISSELLSLFTAVTTTGEVIAWLILALLSMGFGLSGRLFKQGWRRLQVSIPRLAGHELIYVAMIGIIFLLAFVTGFLSPPNNNDSLLYHLPRIAHWIQSGSLAHHATAYINQLSYPIWAEEAIMGVWLFTGVDTFSFLIQWLAFAGCIINVTMIAKQITASRPGQWLSLFFALSLPAALLQSSSTQNDIVTAFWFTSMLFFIVLAIKRPLSIVELICFAGSLALGMLTKATFYPYASALLVVFSYLMVRRAGWKKGGRLLLIIALFCIILNAGYWGRNLVTFNSPFGSQEMIGANVSNGVNLGILVNPLRNFVLNLLTPSEPRNIQLFGWMFAPAGQKLGGFPDYWVIFAWNDEDYAGNPLHAILIVLTFLILLIRNKRVDRLVWIYMGMVGISYIMLCFVIQYNPYFVRYEIPFFIASAPLFGLAFGNGVKNKWGIILLVYVLFVTALPWILINKTRPLIALRDYPEPLALHANWVTGKTAGSILLEPKSTTFFARSQQYRDPYLQMAEVIKVSGCKEIGLRIDSSDPEYPFWWILGAPISGYRLESIFAFPEAERYLNEEFQPCAVICTICDGQPEWFGLKLIGKYDQAYLYLDE